MTEQLYLGLDAGGSKTVCLAGDRRRTFGRGESGTANPSLSGVAGFRDAIVAAVRQALDGAAPHSVTRAWIGVAGGETPGMRTALRAIARDALDAREVVISHDARLILAAAGVDEGIAVVAGTGSSVYGVSATGRELTVGGWGHLLGDEGSAYDLARQALRAVTQAADGRGPSTRLSDAVLAALGISTTLELRERSYPAPPVSEIADLARVVLELADDDEIAAGIVAHGARELARAVQACRRRLSSDSVAAMPVVVAGGLMNASSPLLARFTYELEQLGGEFRVVSLAVEPAVGALALARDGPAEGPAAEEEPRSHGSKHVHQQPKESLS